MSATATEPEAHYWPITICVMLATIMQALDTTIANVALPYMQGSLSATLDQANWVLTSYIVAAAIMTPPTGWLAARFGRKRLFIFQVAGFTIASVLCGAAQSLTEMVLFRLLQGMCGAALVPLSQAVLLDTWPREKHGSAMALWGVGVMVGPILGPTLGGWLTNSYSWRWVFYVNVPVGVLTILGLVTFLGETERRRIPFDWFGFVTLSVAIGSLQLMLDRGEQLNWFGSTEIVTEAIVAAVAFYLFLAHTFTAERPFVNPRIFTDRNFSVGLVFIFVVGVILLATLALLTPYLQNLMDYPVLTAGMVLAPRGMGTMLMMFVVGRLIGRIDPRLIIGTGLLITAGSLHEMSGFTPDVPQGEIVRTGFTQGLGFGLIFVPLSTVTFATLPAEWRTEATGLFSLMRNIGSSIGISIVMSLLSSNTQVNHATIAAHVTPFNAELYAPAIHHYWNAWTAMGQAALNAVVTEQAQIIAYADDYELMMMLTLASLPLLLLMRRVGRGGAAAHAAVAD
ncbi:DHA2 family efflux MFS transporter permease subunit [Benzoatithermus flavus]|uniref:DHA2 family efflux MFS transporter permease subunit n=1 Tax=Benzoatithermus flavus TaxID=3108223 RepID=A0ABU8XRD2_9PROT